MGAARAPASSTFEHSGGREQALAPGMRRRERLARRELLALHGRLQCVVVAVGTMSVFGRYPPEHRFVGNRVVYATRPGKCQHFAERAFECLVLPLAVPRADPFDEATCVVLVGGVDRGREPFAKRRD